MGRSAFACVSLALLCSLPGSSLGNSFVNWETPHVPPMDMTPDGQRLLVVNTPDNRLEVFDIEGGTPVHLGSIPVGLSGGDFAAAVEECLADDVVATSVIYADPPEPESVFFLVRASDCGTYDSTGQAQVEARDAEIDSAALACSK